MPTRAIFHGSRRKFVLAFDVGTTYSVIFYRLEFPVPLGMYGHTVIIVYSIPVKSLKSKRLQGQQSSAIYFGIVISC